MCTCCQTTTPVSCPGSVWHVGEPFDRKALNTQPWCQVHCGLPTFFDFEAHYPCCVLLASVQWKCCRPTTPTDSPSRGACVHQICAAHIDMHHNAHALHRPKARCLREAARMFFLVPALRGVKWECAEWQVEDFWCFCCVFLLNSHHLVSIVANICIYHMMFNSSMLCHCIMYIWLYMSIMFFSV